MLDSETKIEFLSGVGPKMAEKMKRLGITDIRDLLFYYPRTWQDFSKPALIRDLKVGQEAIIEAEIVQLSKGRTFRRRMSIIEALLKDKSGSIRAVWFNQPFLVQVLKPGQVWLFAGKVNYDFKNGAKQLVVSQYEKEPVIVPVYSVTEGLTSKFLRKIIQPLLSQVDRMITDYFPSKYLVQENLVSLTDALKKIHQPKNTSDLRAARQRLGFDELFLIALRMALRRKKIETLKAPKITIKEKLLKNFTEKLSFKLTNAQRRAAWEIIKDLAGEVPMNRLLEGDVGSGKTIVAAMAVLVACDNRYQTIWLAPTEILANQHYKNVSKILTPFGVKVGLLTGANKDADLKLDNLIIGTHALLQQHVSFRRLGLIIVDEQHRFGVEQRGYLRKKEDLTPHFLSMTATPIPRSMALSIYGDLDLSVIDELPPGRQKIITRIVEAKNRSKAYQFINAEIKKGRQAFVICPLIEEDTDGNSGKLFDIDKKTVLGEYEKLSKSIFPFLKIGLLHGRLKPAEKERVMTEFNNGKIDILVSTAVVEVGIDVPNATVMMVEGAEHFGLAQLHQFRGRVGRGSNQSYCFLFSNVSNENTQQRLTAMVKSDNGFELAEKDLQIRGPGELVGLKQSGLPDLKMASFSDIILVKRTRNLADKIVSLGIENFPEMDLRLKSFEKDTHLE